MQQDKVKIKLSGVSETLLGPLWARAQLSKEYSSLFHDAKAVELVEKIDYDLSTSDMPFEGILFSISLKGNLPAFSLWALRAKQFDNKVKAYIAEHPRASIVNIGAGLDTTFYRVDNGTIHWYDLDLPAVIDIRRQLLPEPNRATCIAKSLLDPSWCEDIEHTEDGVFMVAGGVLPFFEESQVKEFFSMLADNFPGGEIVFNALSKLELDNNFRAWIEQFPPEQRDTMRAALMEALKEWWEKAPQDQKDKVNDMIAMLKTPTKPKGKEWADLEAWWDQLSDKEKDEAWHGFRIFPHIGFVRWTLEDANEITKWDSRITVVDQLPMFKNISKDPSLSRAVQRFMDWSDEHSRSNIFLLRV
jgi:O-methyltransferase involved in polyketide biosynthesis